MPELRAESMLSCWYSIYLVYLGRHWRKTWHNFRPKKNLISIITEYRRSWTACRDTRSVCIVHIREMLYKSHVFFLLSILLLAPALYRISIEKYSIAGSTNFYFVVEMPNFVCTTHRQLRLPVKLAWPHLPHAQTCPATYFWSSKRQTTKSKECNIRQYINYFSPFLFPSFISIARCCRFSHFDCVKFLSVRSTISCLLSRPANGERHSLCIHFWSKLFTSSQIHLDSFHAAQKPTRQQWQWKWPCSTAAGRSISCSDENIFLVSLSLRMRNIRQLIISHTCFMEDERPKMLTLMRSRRRFRRNCRKGKYSQLIYE